ncbi:MAG: tol-pal system protein YbgF [Desulfurella sp.]|jgi:tol-pal system protein YbgF
MKKVLIVLVVLLSFSCSAFAQENPYSSQLEQISKNTQDIKTLQSNQASLYLKIEDLLVKYGELKGRIDDLARKIESIQTSSGASPEIKEKVDKLEAEVNALKQQLPSQSLSSTQASVPQASTQASPLSPEEADFKKAKALYDAKEYNQAIKAFSAFQKTYKNSKLNDQALFYIADSYYNLKIYDKAIINFDQIVNTYPKSKFASLAMLKEGLSFINLGDKIDGRFLLEKVIKTYPNSQEAKQAKVYLEKYK